jgi:hypothetical protein
MGFQKRVMSKCCFMWYTQNKVLKTKLQWGTRKVFFLAIYCTKIHATYHISSNFVPPRQPFPYCTAPKFIYVRYIALPQKFHHHDMLHQSLKEVWYTYNGFSKVCHIKVLFCVIGACDISHGPKVFFLVIYCTKIFFVQHIASSQTFYLLDSLFHVTMRQSLFFMWYIALPQIFNHRDMSHLSLKEVQYT